MCILYYNIRYIWGLGHIIRNICSHNTCTHVYSAHSIIVHCILYVLYIYIYICIHMRTHTHSPGRLHTGKTCHI